MRVSLRHRRFVVIDDLLEPGQFEFLHQSLTRLKYSPAGGMRPAALWSLAEPQAFRGTPFTSADDARSLGPDRAGYAVFVQALETVLPELEPLIGQRGQSWTQFNGNTVLHPPHSALNWHADRKYAGSYSFYFQKGWSPRWGGELLIRDAEVRNGHPAGDDGTETARVDDAGYFLGPIANRLVVMKGDTDHRIAAVSPAAGENFRMSITGFFSRTADGS